MVGKIVQETKCLLHEHGDKNSNSQHQSRADAAASCNPSTKEAKAKYS